MEDKSTCLSTDDVARMEMRVMSVGCTDSDFRKLMDSHETLRAEVIRANADVANCCDKRDDLCAEVARLTRERDALSRRCEVRFRLQQKLRAEVERLTRESAADAAIVEAAIALYDEQGWEFTGRMPDAWASFATAIIRAKRVLESNNETSTT